MMKRLLLLIASALMVSCNAEPMDKTPAKMPEVPEGAEVITLGAGCFWCTEAVFDQIDGVHSAVSGYMGGQTENPTYEEVVGGTTGHAEVTQVVYDPKKVSTNTILEWFFKAHDPTQLNRQGNDVGTQYRSAIFYHTDEQKAFAEKAKVEANKLVSSPIVTEITKATQFYPAENYHQGYYFNDELGFRKNKGYCDAVIQPKLKKLKLKN